MESRVTFTIVRRACKVVRHEGNLGMKIFHPRRRRKSCAHPRKWWRNIDVLLHRGEYVRSQFPRRLHLRRNLGVNWFRNTTFNTDAAKWSSWSTPGFDLVHDPTKNYFNLSYSTTSAASSLVYSIASTFISPYLANPATVPTLLLLHSDIFSVKSGPSLSAQGLHL